MTDARNSTITAATVFINGNYLMARQALLRLLPERRLHMIVPDDANMTRFSMRTGLHPNRIEPVPSTEAFPKAFDRLKALQWEHGDVVVIIAGMVGRILASTYFSKFSNTTFLELGSFFDRDFYHRSKGARYYHGNTRPSCMWQGDTHDKIMAENFHTTSTHAYTGKLSRT